MMWSRLHRHRWTNAYRALVVTALLLAAYTAAYVVVRAEGILRFDGTSVEQIDGFWYLTGPGRVVRDPGKSSRADQIALVFRPASWLEEKIRNRIGWYPKSEVML